MVYLKGMDHFPERWKNNCKICPFWQEETMMGPGYCIAKYAVYGISVPGNNGKYPCPFGECRPYKEDLDDQI